MPTVRDHEPIIIEQFNGLWRRGARESTPLDHFTDAENVQYPYSAVKTRDPLDKFQNQAVALGNIVRFYNYVQQTGESLLVLVSGGSIYHCIGPSTVHGPILTIPTMVDFDFENINGRAYITPIQYQTNALGFNFETGLQNEFVYVYKGDGTAARKAAGFPPSNTSKKPFIAFNSAIDGAITKGIHVIAVSFDGGILGPEVFAVVDAPGDKEIELTNIPIGGFGVASRTIVMTRAIDPKDYNANDATKTYYTAITIPDNTTVNIRINIPDSALTTVYVPGVTAAPVTNALLVRNTDIDGNNDFGFRLIGVVYETDTGYLTAPGPEFFGAQTSVDIKKAIKIDNIPTSPTSFVTKRHLVSTKVIPDYNGDQKGFQFFFIPGGNIDDNVTTTKTLSWYDADLLDDASHLIDNFSEIAAGVFLSSYHGRMAVGGEFANISVCRLSAPGEPEAISQVDGLIIVPPDGNPLTQGQEFRDIFYLFKKTRTVAYVDNNNEPASWEQDIVDQGVGVSIHGIATVLDSGGVNVDFLLMIDYSGLMIFNGTYTRPEMSWKIEDYWFALGRNNFREMQIMNDSLGKKIFITLPSPTRHKMLFADYQNGLDAKNLRWAEWVFDAKISTITLMETNKLIIGALEEA